MVDLCGSSFGPDRYQLSVDWLLKFLQALFDILPLVSYCTPYPDVGDLHLLGLNILRWLRPNLFFQM